MTRARDLASNILPGNWIAYTPTFTNFTLGNASTSFAYSQLGKTVNVRYTISLGSTSSVGTGPTFSLPIASAGMPITYYNALYLDSGTAFFNGTLNLTPTVAALLVIRTDGLYPTILGVNATTPFTWTNGDYIGGTFTYQGA